MAPYSGEQKVRFCERLGKDWSRLADFFQIPQERQAKFQKGDEPKEVWEWLEERDELKRLPSALKAIDRNDIAKDILEQGGSERVWPGSPFPGLAHFTEDDARIFFGRDEETQQLLDRLTKNRFVAVVGASGSGKSSLVGAGLIPRLNEIPGVSHWERVRFTPGGLTGNPFVELVQELRPMLERSRLTRGEIAEISGRLQAGGDLATVANRITEGCPADAELLLFVDQFEELFKTEPKYHVPFIEMLERAAAQETRVRTVITLRADFYPRCLDHRPLVRLLLVGDFPLAAPDQAALRDMITMPAAMAGLKFDTGLVQRILRETGNEPGALALMAFALSELYEACKPNKTLSEAAYDSFGGVKGAIAKRADTAYGQLGQDVANNVLGEVFKELVDVDPERGVPTRKPALLKRFSGSAAALKLIENFREARLLVADQELLEVAHEALLTNWPTLKQWIEERFDEFRLLRQVRQDAAEWERRGKIQANLWRHERLGPVYKMIKSLQPELSRTEQEFIRPTAERLLEEIADPATTHQRRSHIGERLAEIGDPRPGVGRDKRGLPDIGWCPVPGGAIKLQRKAGTFKVDPFCISRYLVTWAQYRSFLEAQDGYRKAEWWEGLAEREEDPGSQWRKLDNHPAENVSWYDAVAFCRWLSQQLGYEVRLPTEWEWQQAATGGDPEKEYPWGKEWNPDYANTYESGLAHTTAVGMYPQGESPVGALDMSGNVLEWCLNEYAKPKNIGLSGDARRAVRGGSLFNDQNLARATYRDDCEPGPRYLSFGFRVVSSSPNCRTADH